MAIKNDMHENKLSPTELAVVLKRCLAAKRPAMIWGPPGIGKSEIVAQVADSLSPRDEHGKTNPETAYRVVDIRLLLMEPTDLRGIPYFDLELKKMNWAQPVDLPEPTDPRPTIIFLDELTAAPQSVQAAAYQLVLDRKIGTYTLPENAFLLAAGNRLSDRGVAQPMPTPLANRFLHFDLEVRFDDWADWAISRRIHEDVLGFLSAYKSKLHQFDPGSAAKAFATPRSWKFVSDILYAESNLDEDLIGKMVTGAVGSGLALEFMSHRKMAKDLPTAVDILAGKVDKLGNREISAQYSLVVSLCYELDDMNKKLKDGTIQKDKNGRDVKSKKSDLEVYNEMVDNFLGFIMDNFKKELTVLSMRSAIKHYAIRLVPKDLKNWQRFYKEYGTLITDAANQ